MTTLTDTQVITASGGLVELGYSQITSNVGVSGTTAGSPTVIVPDLTFVSDGGPLLIEFSAPYAALTTSGAGSVTFGFWIDGAQYSQPSGVYEGQTGTISVPVHAKQRVTLSAGSHTVRVVAYRSGTAATVYAGSGTTGADAPAFLRVSKIVQATQWPAVTTGTIICTSSTRPSAPFEGQTIYETDTDLEQRWTGTYWSQVWPQAFVTASNTTTQTGPANSDFVYADATITLTAGSWLVQGTASIINTVTSDASAVGLYSLGTFSEVSSSRGPAATVGTAAAVQLTSRLVLVTVSAGNVNSFRVLCTRNGGSTIRSQASSGAPAAALWAQKVG